MRGQETLTGVFDGWKCGNASQKLQDWRGDVAFEMASFKPEFDTIRWETGKHADEAFSAWQTSYPLVDAAMIQINQTGYMHNRLRMATASFLVKDPGIDWRWGRRYFAERLKRL